MTKFYEESPGVASASRLAALVLAGCCAAMSLTACYVAIRDRDTTAGIIAALAAPIGSCAAGVWGSLRERNRGVSDADG